MINQLKQCLKNYMLDESQTFTRLKEEIQNYLISIIENKCVFKLYNHNELNIKDDPIKLTSLILIGIAKYNNVKLNYTDYDIYQNINHVSARTYINLNRTVPFAPTDENYSIRSIQLCNWLKKLCDQMIVCLNSQCNIVKDYHLEKEHVNIYCRLFSYKSNSNEIDEVVSPIVNQYYANYDKCLN